MADAFTGFSTTPIGAKLIVNGSLVATTPYSAMWFKAGDSIRIELEGYKTLYFSLGADRVGKSNYYLLEKSAAPAPPAVAYGDVQVRSQPSNAKIFIDGEDTGKKTNYTLRLKTGAHTILLKKDGYVDLSWLEAIKEESRVLSLKFLAQVPIAPPVAPPAPAVRTTQVVFSDLLAAIKANELWNAAKLFLELWSAPITPELTTASQTNMLAFISPAGGANLIKLFGEHADDAVSLFSKLNIERQSAMVRELVKSGNGINTLNGLMKKNALNPAVVRPAISAIDEAVKGMIKGFSLVDIKKMLPWLGAVVVVMGTTNFIEFLYEEMLQTQGMAIYVAIANKQWSTAKETLDKARPRLETATWIYTNLGWLAPYAWNVFKSYAAATKLQYDAYEAVISKNAGSTGDPGVGGKVFNLTDFKKNLSAGTAPDVDKMIASQVEGAAETIKIRSIKDGDTILGLLPNTSIEQSIRLLGIDAPERGAIGYKESKTWLNSQLLGAEVTLQIDTAQPKDKYGRILAIVLKNGENISLKSLRAGWSIYYPYAGNIYVDEAAFKAAEAEAKAAKLGLWKLTGAGEPSAPEELAKITKQEFINEAVKFYTGRMYMSKKELNALVEAYDTSEIEDLIDEIYTFYTGRMYMSKKELKELAAKYSLDVAGL
jgi:endonuclease YncB( thermonuclease family)